jgi:hypothetical protein
MNRAAMHWVAALTTVALIGCGGLVAPIDLSVGPDAALALDAAPTVSRDSDAGVSGSKDNGSPEASAEVDAQSLAEATTDSAESGVCPNDVRYQIEWERAGVVQACPNGNECPPADCCWPIQIFPKCVPKLTD